MEDAKTLIRMAARAFYGKAGVRHTLIIDALAVHSTLPNEDLSLLLGIQQKDLRKLCGKLREDRMISVHSRQETREGMQRPIHRDWYYLNFYLTIDAIKYRVWALTNRVKDQYKPSDEKKDYFCPRCKAEWTQMEVLSNVSMSTGEFACQKCGFTLERHETSEADRAGHERLSRLMSQLDPLIRMLRRIDEQDIPSNDFEQAEALRVPINRDESLNPSRRLEPLSKRDGAGGPGGASRFVKADAGPQVEVSLVEADQAERDRREAALKQEAQNQLPEWHTMSTVTGEKTALGLVEQARQAAVLPLGKPDADAEEKKAAAAAADDADGVDQSMMDAYFAQLRAEQEREARGSGSDDDDEDEDDEDEDEFEDVGIGAEGSNVGTPASSGGTANGLAPRENGMPTSSPLKRASPDSDSATPGTSAAQTPRDDFGGRSPAKRPRIDAPSAPAAASSPAADSDDEEEFEDAL